MPDEYDVIIVGSGAGGGTLAHRLAPSGKRVLVLERGDWLPREIENWDAKAAFVDNRYVSADTWYDETAKTVHPRSTTSWAAPRSSTARRCTGCGSRTSVS
jgi:choline dehydrogenase-like flavoprotein